MMKIRSVLRKQLVITSEDPVWQLFGATIFITIGPLCSVCFFWPFHVNLHGGDGPNMLLLQTVSITVPKYPPAQYQHPLINSDTEKKGDT